jgi:hypothetical protein
VSDENASEDNFDENELYQEVYLRGHLKEKELSTKI